MSRTIEASTIKGSRASVEIQIPDSLKVLEAEKAPEGYGTFRIMTQKDGDKRIVWDSSNFNQIVEAKDLFNKCVAEGLVPYKVGIGGKATSEVMNEFDPHAEEVIFMPVTMVTGG